MWIVKTQYTDGNNTIVVKLRKLPKTKKIWFACYTLFANHNSFPCNQESKCKIITCHNDTFNCYF